MRTTTVEEQGWASVDRLFDRLVSLRIGRAEVHVSLVIASALPLMNEMVAGATRVLSQGEISYYASGDNFYIVAARGGFLHTDCARQTIAVHVTANLFDDPALLDDLLSTAVAPLLRRRGFFSLHAFAAAWRGQGALLVGASGSGKTTAGLALVRSGWKFLSDDSPLLRSRESEIDVVGWHDPVNVTWTTALFFPELQSIFSDGHSELKCTCAIDQIYGDVLAEKAAAALLLFPQLGTEECSTATRLGASDALTELLAQSLDAWDKGVIKDHFELLSSMVERPAYRLHLGRDFDRLPDLIANLLQTR